MLFAHFFDMLITSSSPRFESLNLPYAIYVHQIYNMTVNCMPTINKTKDTIICLPSGFSPPMQTGVSCMLNWRSCIGQAPVKLPWIRTTNYQHAKCLGTETRTVLKKTGHALCTNCQVTHSVGGWLCSFSSSRSFYTLMEKWISVITSTLLHKHITVLLVTSCVTTIKLIQLAPRFKDGLLYCRCNHARITPMFTVRKC